MSIFKAKKFTAAILVKPVCSKTLVCRSSDETPMALIAPRIFYERFVCFRFTIIRPQIKKLWRVKVVPPRCQRLKFTLAV